MSQKTFVSRAPKRRIERVRNDIELSLSTSVVQTSLHTCEDKKTLVRAMLRMILYGESNALHRAKFALSVSPAGSNVVSPALSSSLDQDEPNQAILQFPMAGYGDTTSATPPAIVIDTLELDTKAMRKLNAGDIIKLAHIANNVNVRAYGTIYLWFKE